MEGVEHHSSVVGMNNRGALEPSREDRDAIGAFKYEEGFQQGYLAAKDAMDTIQNQGRDSSSTHPRSIDPAYSPAPSFGNVGANDRERTPPPNPLRHVKFGCNTTPHGTPIPRGPPPPDAGLRDLGSVGSACSSVGSVLRTGWIRGCCWFVHRRWTPER